MCFTSRPSISFVLTISVALCVPVHAENWTQFRGSNGQGISRETNLPIEWSATENVVWTTRIPGNGWSSPIVYDDNVFLTTATDEGTSCRVICVNRENGDIAWDKDVHRQETGAKRAQNSYATPTPVTDGKQVNAVFADGSVDFVSEIVDVFTWWHLGWMADANIPGEY